MSCITEAAGHARKLVKELVLSNWYGIVVVSGDGLIFEVCDSILFIAQQAWLLRLYLQYVLSYLLTNRRVRYF